MTAQGILQAITGALGESDSDIGGLVSTRLTSPISIGTTSFPVESTLDWEPTGKLAIDGIVYSYASKTLTSFQGITHLANQVVIPGAFKAHRAESGVLDLNRIRSAIELARRAMLVDYAEGEDLSAIGRRNGVLRLPFLGGDDRFRPIVKYLGYNPRGTLYGLELALTGLVGAGNFEIYEDLVRNPCKVFIRLNGAAATTDSAQGKTFLTGSELHNPSAVDQIPIDEVLINRGTLHGIFFAPENLFTDVRTSRPTTQMINEFPAAPATQAWRYYGGTEASNVALANPGIQFLYFSGDARYYRSLRTTQYGNVEVEILAMVPAGFSEPSAKTVLTIGDGVREAAATFRVTGASTFLLGLSYYSGGVWVPSGTVTLSTNQWRTIKLKKNGQSSWEIWVDGQRVLSSDYLTTSHAQLERRVTLGVTGATTSGIRVKQIQVKADDITDLSSLYGRTASRVSNNQIDIGISLLSLLDVGKEILLSGSIAVNAQGGNNNGRWKIVSRDSASQVTVDGILGSGASVSVVNPVRVTIPVSEGEFQFPDDLGKTIQLSGSILGNNGTWTITKLLDPDTLVDLGSWKTAIPTKTNVCEVSGSSFVSEPGLAWQLHPMFVAESGLRFDIAGTSTVVPGLVTVRIPFPTFSSPDFTPVFGVVYSAVLSAQVLLDASVANALIQETPELWTRYYPFYLADPLGFVRSYLDDILAAGVIPDYLIV